MNYLLAIDQGTSSTRAMLYDVDGVLLKSSQYSLAQSYPHPGWVEQNPDDIWQTTLSAIREVVIDCPKGSILACGVTNQRETTVVWDKQTGECLYPAIVWQDRRTQSYCDSLKEASEHIRHKTGLFPDPYFSASKLRWLLHEMPEVKQLVSKNRLAFGTIDSFLIWKLTNGARHVTDVTNASRTLLFNIYEKKWDEALLDLFDIPHSILPEVLSCDAYFGEINADLLGHSIPITGVAGDQQAALIGQACLETGMAKATFGTGAFLLLNTGSEPVLSQHQLLTTIAYDIQNQTTYGLEGSIYQAGTTVKWLRDELQIISASSETELLAQQLSSNEGVYFVPSFTGLGAPYWLSTEGAVVVGLSRTSNRAHFARAALESVCYQTRDVLECMQEDAGHTINILRVDGGMASNQWFLQFLATQCQCVIERPQDTETTAYGTAMLAALGAKRFTSLKEITANWRAEMTLSPEENHKQREQDYLGWKKAISMIQSISC